MSRRLPKEEKPYNPIEAALVQSVSVKTEPVTVQTPAREEPSKVVALPHFATFEQVGATKAEQPKDAPLGRSGREKRVILSWEEETALGEIVEGMSRDLHTPVKLSNLLRACVILLRHGEGEIRKASKQSSAMMRPSNSDHAAIAYFEHRLAKIIQQGLKNTRYLD